MLKWLLVAIGVLVVLAGVAIAALPWLVNTPAVHAHVAQAVTNALGRPARFSSLSVTALPLPTIRLRDLRVAEDPAFGPGPFLTVGEGRIRLRLRPLLSGRIELADLTLEAPRIAVIEDATGRLNVASLGAPTVAASGSNRGAAGRHGAVAPAGLLLSSVRIADGAVSYQRLAGKTPALTLDKIDVTVSQDAPGEALRLHGRAIVRPGDVRLGLAEASLMPSGTRLVGDMAVRATVDVEASDVAGLAAAFLQAPSVSGAMKGQLEVTGTAARVSVIGTMTLDRVTLASERATCGEPKRRQLVVESLRMPIAAGLTQLDSAPIEAKVAKGAVSLHASLVYSSGAATLKDISVKGMELAPVLAEYLCQPYAVTGPLDLTGGASLRLAEALASVDGSGRIRIGPGKVVGREVVGLVRDVVGLGTAIAAVTRPDRPPRSSPLDFDSITATYTIARGVARTDDLLYTARDVKVMAAGTYGLADGRLAMEVTLTEGANQVKGVIAGAPGSLRVVPTGAKVRDRDIRKFLDRIFR